MSAIYNELDPFAAQWLRNLIEAGHIAPGKVDDRSICDLGPGDVAGPGQRHFFAGIGGWSHALRLAGVGDGESIWTASLPCQPFSGAGKRAGFADERHLWPVFFRLVEVCRPPVLCGEQVASPDGLVWLDVVRADLEDLGYAFWAVDLPAACVGAPHERQRLFWMAYAASAGRGTRRAGEAQLSAEVAGEPRRPGSTRLRVGNAKGDRRDKGRRVVAARPGPADDGGLGNARSPRLEGRNVLARPSGPDGRIAAAPGLAGRMGHADCDGIGRDPAAAAAAQAAVPGEGPQPRGLGDGARAPGADGFWSDLEWLPCTDGKWRPTQRGLFPLVAGTAFRLADGRSRQDTSRAALLRGIGNAIVPQVAATFITAALDAIEAGAA